MPPSGWPVPGVVGPALSPPTPSPPSWVPMQGPNDLGTAGPADGGCSRGLPYTRYRCCLMAGPVEATGQGMCCFQVVDVRCNTMQTKWKKRTVYVIP